MKVCCLFELAALLLFSSSWYNALQAQEVEIPDPIQAPNTEAWTTTLAPKDSVRLGAFLKKGCSDSTYFVGQLQEIRGTVQYLKRLASYVIIHAFGSDSQYIYLLCNWSGAAQWLNKPVIFSGRRYQARGVLAETGGETVLYLYVTAIRQAQQ